MWLPAADWSDWTSTDVSSIFSVVCASFSYVESTFRASSSTKRSDATCTCPVSILLGWGLPSVSAYGSMFVLVVWWLYLKFDSGLTSIWIDAIELFLSLNFLSFLSCRLKGLTPGALSVSGANGATKFLFSLLFIKTCLRSIWVGSPYICIAKSRF